jgi:lipopolysaccharide transport system ATP-binding protein
MTWAIRADNLAKRYRLRHSDSGQAPQPVRSTFGASAKLLWSRLRGERQYIEDFWALKDVSFEVQEGEALGVIGPNGAGKSTLLKILSRITRPTTGEAVIRGRVVSLLEVGTGFHKELTGRENVFLSGSILGMHRSEIQKKFDEIVDFSGIGRFLDMPVKHYSSGMYVRLAFSVAAHLEPEILIVDEVLSVGDASFQERCLEKMDDVAQLGRTILLVSHNMMAIQKLCRSAIALNQGHVVDRGDAPDVALRYLSSEQQSVLQLSHESSWPDLETAPGNDHVRLTRACIRPRNGSPSDIITMQQPLLVEIDFWNPKPDTSLTVTLHFSTREGIIAFSTRMLESMGEAPLLDQGIYRGVCEIPANLLNAGVLNISAFLLSGVTIVYRHPNLISFSVLDDTGAQRSSTQKRPGILQPRLEWKVQKLPDVDAGQRSSDSSSE